MGKGRKKSPESRVFQHYLSILGVADDDVNFMIGSPTPKLAESSRVESHNISTEYMIWPNSLPQESMQRPEVLNTDRKM